jgi:hypothetical protein
MNEKDSYEITEKALAALRLEEDAVRIISERLGVREMGPADHIRTKHEVKAFVDSPGGENEAHALITRARARRDVQRSTSLRERLGEHQSRGRDISS